jgi:hypothetical protein
MEERTMKILWGITLAALAIAGTGLAQAGRFPATGQTTSYHAADDGAIRAGGVLRYTDNRNGTITDRNTSLVWEKKSYDGSIHDVRNPYTWDEAFSVHVAALNNHCANNATKSCSSNRDCPGGVTGLPGKCGFAGKRDWRVPNYKELVSLLNLQNVGPAVSPVFNTNCVEGATVLTGSCSVLTGPNAPTNYDYWSSTSFVFATNAWFVDFVAGHVGNGGKGDRNAVRAVRGGFIPPLKLQQP